VWIAAAKDDPRKKGRELYVPRIPVDSTSAQLCAVAGLERWLEAVGTAGPIFRTFDLRGRLTETRLDRGTSPGSFDGARLIQALKATSPGIHCDVGL